MVNGLREVFGQTIEGARAAGPFVSVDDFAHRTDLGQAVIKRLAEADAFRSLGVHRRQAVWQSLAQEKKPKPLPLFDPLPLPSEEGRFEGVLPPMPLHEEVVADYRSAGLSLRAHPISFYRSELARLGVTPAGGLANLANESPVLVAGLVLLRQRPGTAKGITFVTLEDETGTVNLVVHQRTWDRYYRIARRAPAWIARGHVQTTRDGPKGRHHAAAVIHVVVRKLEALPEALADFDVKSRDFR
jgi:error-prone DNA polymerase